MVLSDYINQLPNLRSDMIDSIAAKTKTSRGTVLRWIKGEVMPPPIKQDIISDILKIPVSELFPKEDVDRC